MLNIRFATKKNIPVIKCFIIELAEYEKLLDQVSADEKKMEFAMFKEKSAQALIAEEGGAPVEHAIFFCNFSRSSAKKAYSSRTFISNPKCATAVTANRCSNTWPGWQKIKTAAGWNKIALPGTNLPLP